jgi:flavin reductase (DIM6/NTAB) family NADH-FMN oxidoreductase RutF
MENENMDSLFSPVTILDNFYQASSFFPMPVVLVSTVAETGQINLGPYSLCFPHVVTGKGRHAMMLVVRSDSNTSVNIIRTGLCSINFIPDKKKFMKNCVMLGYPGETTEEKMKNSIFTLTSSDLEPRGESCRPDLVREALQVFECTWDDSYPLTDTEGAIEYHFLLRIDRILLTPKWKKCLQKGRGFPRMPIDYGFRDNNQFWFARHSRPYRVPIPASKETTILAVQYACTHYDPDVVWQDDACRQIVKVPKIFLKKVIAGVVDAAKKEGITEITPEFLEKVRDKRR